MLVSTVSLKYILLLRRISCLKILVDLNLVLYFSYYLISRFKFTADEIMSRVHHQFHEVRMNFKTGNSSIKELHT